MPATIIPKPFVKWAGGKGHLITQLEALFPEGIMARGNVTYIEPFVGGGAMLFHVLQKYKAINKVIINDINPDLISCYNLIKQNPHDLIDELQILQSQYKNLDENSRKQLYYNLRDLYNTRTVNRTKQAALFIFLNQTCFNGLYRVNSKSEFNVPCGKYKNPHICNEDVIMADHKILNSVELIILNEDYKKILSQIDHKGNVFVYLDPPYMPLSVTSYFKQYSSSPFGDKEQIELHDSCQRLDEAGIHFMLSNSDCKTEDGQSFFEKLYSEFNTERISARRYINAHTEKRDFLSEVVIRNYKL